MFKLLFYLFSCITIVSAGTILFIHNLIHSALMLIVSLTAVAALFVLAGADFLGVAQVMIYIGGILVLILFGIMLTKKEENEVFPSSKSSNFFLGLIISVFLSVVIIWIQSQLGFTDDQNTPTQLKGSTINQIGVMVLSKNLLGLELAGVLLTLALIGASMIAVTKEPSKSNYNG